MRKKYLSIFLITFLLIVVIWLGLNPTGRFGYHRYGLTVYSGIPFPIVDIRINKNGIPGIRKKSHFISLDEVKPLIQVNPDVLIIGNGYDEVVQVDERILGLQEVEVKVLATPDAIKLFNELRGKGKTVVAIIHSTC